jgi:chromate reductase
MPSATLAGTRIANFAHAIYRSAVYLPRQIGAKLSGVLKNVIDWLSRGSDSVLVGKPVAVIGASTGNWGTRLAQAALRQVLTAT